MLKTLGKEIKEYKKASILTPIFMILEVIFETLIPVFMGMILNISEEDTIGSAEMRHILLYGFFMLLLAAGALWAGIMGGKYGALAAMGGALYFLSDVEQWNVNASAVPGMGFNGIAAAFLGGLNPIGCIFSSYFITHITVGGGNVDLSHYCAQIADFISAVIIYLCGFVLFFKTVMNGWLKKSEEKKIARARAAAEEANKEGGNA